MAMLRLVLENKEEQEEKKELMDWVHEMKREDQLRLKGFLEGVALFMDSSQHKDKVVQ